MQAEFLLQIKCVSKQNRHILFCSALEKILDFKIFKYLNDTLFKSKCEGEE